VIITAKNIQRVKNVLELEFSMSYLSNFVNIGAGKIKLDDRKWDFFET